MANRLIGVASNQIQMGSPGAPIVPGKVHWNGDGVRSLYVDWYNANINRIGNGPWCAMFVSWCATLASVASIIPMHAYCPSGKNEWIRRGRWHFGRDGIQRGDIVYFQWAGSSVPNHVGIVESVAGSTVYTIEGNTRTPGFGNGSQSNGGTVARKERGPEYYIAGYGRPNYGSLDDLLNSGHLPTPVNYSDGTGRYLTSDGYWGSNTTRALQKYFGTYIDGEIWGQYSAHRAKNPGLTSGWVWTSNPQGSPLIKAMQNWLGVGADGVAGPTTFSALQRKLGMKYVDGVLWSRSPAIAEMQNRLNAGNLNRPVGAA